MGQDTNKGGGPLPALSRRLARGSTWAVGGLIGQQVLRLGSNLILTRLLFPEAFGLMALVNVVLMGMSLFSDVGLAPSVVRSRRGDDPVFLDTAWTVQIIRGCGLWIIVSVLAFPLARFYDEPMLRQMLPVAGLALLLEGFRSTSLLSLQRHIAVATQTAVTLGSQLIGIVVMITWAMLYPTVWALVGGGLVVATSTLILSHVIGNHRNRIRWNSRALKELVGFGKWIFVSTALTFLAGQIDRLLFAKLVPLGALGVYSIGLTLARIPEELAVRLAGIVVFPAFSRKLDSDSDLAPAFHRVRTPLLSLSGLLTVCLCASGVLLVDILYDNRYAEAGWILQLLAAGVWFVVLVQPAGAALLAMGLPEWLALALGAKLIAIGLLIPAGFWLWGFQGAVLGVAISQVLLYATISAGAYRHGVRSLGSDLIMTVFAAISVFGGEFARARVSDVGGGTIAQFAATVTASSMLWIVFMEALARHRGESLTKLLVLILNTRRQTD